MRVLASVRYLVVQFNPVQQPVMAYGMVPIAVSQGYLLERLQ